MPKKSSQGSREFGKKSAIAVFGGFGIASTENSSERRLVARATLSLFINCGNRRLELAKKLPANLRSTGIRFRELTDAILGYSASHHRDTRNIKSRIKKVLPDTIS